ncbi:unnamed protein product [Amoebophrya sp. A120]|nr:unnamed protein product [Amoebophrya sp. A120]|eukprot:GSA120T00008118001.1
MGPGEEQPSPSCPSSAAAPSPVSLLLQPATTTTSSSSHRGRQYTRAQPGSYSQDLNVLADNKTSNPPYSSTSPSLGSEAEGASPNIKQQVSYGRVNKDDGTASPEAQTNSVSSTVALVEQRFLQSDVGAGGEETSKIGVAAGRETTAGAGIFAHEATGEDSIFAGGVALSTTSTGKIRSPPALSSSAASTSMATIGVPAPRTGSSITTSTNTGPTQPHFAVLSPIHFPGVAVPRSSGRLQQVQLPASSAGPVVGTTTAGRNSNTSTTGQNKLIPQRSPPSGRSSTSSTSTVAARLPKLKKLQSSPLTRIDFATTPGGGAASSLLQPQSTKTNVGSGPSDVDGPMLLNGLSLQQCAGTSNQDVRGHHVDPAIRPPDGRGPGTTTEDINSHSASTAGSTAPPVVVVSLSASSQWTRVVPGEHQTNLLARTDHERVEGAAGGMIPLPSSADSDTEDLSSRPIHGERDGRGQQEGDVVVITPQRGTKGSTTTLLLKKRPSAIDEDDMEQEVDVGTREVKGNPLVAQRSHLDHVSGGRGSSEKKRKVSGGSNRERLRTSPRSAGDEKETTSEQRGPPWQQQDEDHDQQLPKVENKVTQYTQSAIMGRGGAGGSSSSSASSRPFLFSTHDQPVAIGGGTTRTTSIGGATTTTGHDDPPATTASSTSTSAPPQQQPSDGGVGSSTGGPPGAAPQKQQQRPNSRGRTRKMTWYEQLVQSRQQQDSRTSETSADANNGSGVGGGSGAASASTSKRQASLTTPSKQAAPLITPPGISANFYGGQQINFLGGNNSTSSTSSLQPPWATAGGGGGPASNSGILGGYYNKPPSPNKTNFNSPGKLFVDQQNIINRSNPNRGHQTSATVHPPGVSNLDGRQVENSGAGAVATSATKTTSSTAAPMSRKKLSSWQKALMYGCYMLMATGNTIYFKKMTTSLANYSWFTTNVTTIVFIPFFYFATELEKMWEQKAGGDIPKRKTAVMGLLDACAGMTMVLGGAYTAGGTQVLLTQGAIPVTILLSVLLLRRRFHLYQYLGAAVIVGGVAVSKIGPQAATTDSGDNVTFNMIFASSNFPTALSTIYKEVAFQDVPNLSVNLIQMWVAVFQGLFNFVLCPLYTLPILGPSQIPLNDMIPSFIDGAKCFIGINTVKDDCDDGTFPRMQGLRPCDKCDAAGFATTMYISFNIAYNILCMLLVKYGTASFYFVINAARLPITSVLFASPVIMGSSAVPMRMVDWFALFTVLIGLVVYKGGAKMLKRQEKQAKTSQEKMLREKLLQQPDTSHPDAVSTTTIPVPSTTASGSVSPSTSIASPSDEDKLPYRAFGAFLGPHIQVFDPIVEVVDVSEDTNWMKTPVQIRAGYIQKLGLLPPGTVSPGASPRPSDGAGAAKSPNKQLLPGWVAIK